MEEIQLTNGFRQQLLDDQKSPKARGFVKDQLLVLRASELPSFKNLIYGEYFHHHDYISCQALREYEAECGLYDRTNRQVPRGLMGEYAARAETTIEEMKKHWRCVTPSTTHDKA